MTANITQNVQQRRRNHSSVCWNHTANGVWLPTKRKFNRQRGSISSATISLGLGIAIIIAVSFLSFFYLGQVLDTASQGADIQSMEERVSELKEQQRELELKGAKLRSIQTIEQHVEELNLTSTDKVSYLTKRPDKMAILEN